MRRGSLVLIAAFLQGCVAWDAGIKPLNPPGRVLPPVPTVTSLTPTLSWTPLKLDDVGATTSLRYELVVYRLDGANKKIIDYARGDLVGTSHTLTAPLLPRTHYYWRVGARYRHGDEDITGDWSGYNYLFLLPPLIGIGTGKAYSFATP
jgi:hypothetical protein